MDQSSSCFTAAVQDCIVTQLCMCKTTCPHISYQAALRSVVGSVSDCRSRSREFKPQPGHLSGGFLPLVWDYFYSALIQNYLIVL